ncbi:MAG: hypothetical protein KIT81_06110 [Alphaproteobacteria bacterium]|nr:hypothetical protein [Alphaproteobacteria bacterium]
MSYEKRPIIVDQAPRGRGPYPQALRCGPFVFLSGQGPLSRETNAPIDASFAEQVELTLDNVSAILTGAGLSLQHVVKVTVYLTDLAWVGEFNALYQKRMPEPRPARTLVQAVLRGIDVEIDAIAMDPAFRWGPEP